MSQVDLAEIRKQLVKKLDTLEDRAQRIESRLSSPGNPDWEENAVLHEDDEVLNALSEKADDDIHDIRLAIKRIDDGSYGLCVHCHKSIPAKRLEVLPFTATCTTCSEMA